MIESVDIQNFKSIKSKYFPLRNLNVLLGLNGMGKSSFIQFLLAFRQSKDILGGRLDINGELVNIGSTKDALYQYAQSSPFAAHLKFSNGIELKYDFDYNMEADFFYDVRYPPNSFMEIEAFKAGLVNRPSITFEALVNNNFQYLQANREEPKTVNLKNYTQVSENKNIGNRGQFTTHFIHKFGNTNVTVNELIHSKSKIKDDLTGVDIVLNSLIDQVNFWMDEISPNINIKTDELSQEYIKLEYVYKQPNLGETNRFKPENVGFGITYGLPVVVALLKAKPGDLVIIENPESHIHPKGQAELGKMIALAAMSGVQLIIETHSDHLVNGIRVAIKENQLDKDKAIVFYFEKEIKSDEQYSKITNIEIDQNGEFSEYPTDMMDEWNNQLMKLL